MEAKKKKRRLANVVIGFLLLFFIFLLPQSSLFTENSDAYNLILSAYFGFKNETSLHMSVRAHAISISLIRLLKSLLAGTKSSHGDGKKYILEFSHVSNLWNRF